MKDIVRGESGIDRKNSKMFSGFKDYLLPLSSVLLLGAGAQTDLLAQEKHLPLDIDKAGAKKEMTIGTLLKTFSFYSKHPYGYVGTKGTIDYDVLTGAGEFVITPEIVDQVSSILPVSNQLRGLLEGRSLSLSGLRERKNSGRQQDQIYGASLMGVFTEVALGPGRGERPSRFIQPGNIASLGLNFFQKDLESLITNSSTFLVEDAIGKGRFSGRIDAKLGVSVNQVTHGGLPSRVSVGSGSLGWDIKPSIVYSSDFTSFTTKDFIQAEDISIPLLPSSIRDNLVDVINKQLEIPIDLFAFGGELGVSLDYTWEGTKLYLNINWQCVNCLGEKTGFGPQQRVALNVGVKRDLGDMYTHAKREAELLKAQKQTEKRKKRAMTAEEENEEQRRDFLQQQAKKDSIILNQQETIDSLQILLSQEHHPDTIYIPTHKDFEGSKDTTEMKHDSTTTGEGGHSSETGLSRPDESGGENGKSTSIVEKPGVKTYYYVELRRGTLPLSWKRKKGSDIRSYYDHKTKERVYTSLHFENKVDAEDAKEEFMSAFQRSESDFQLLHGFKKSKKKKTRSSH